MKSRYQDRQQYFNELAETSKAYYIDYFRRFINLDSGSRILEVGCGEGGNLLPFALSGYAVTGIDINNGKIEAAKIFFESNSAEGEFYCIDFLDFSSQGQVFDAILVHDVFEHIAPDNKQSFLELIHEILAPGGVVFFSFPAWQMPFGGHQQICGRKGLSHFPWLHLLPLPLYRGILKAFKEPDPRIEELLDIRRSKVTVESFERMCKSSGYEILDRTLWFINPHYKVKFGLNPKKLRLGLDRIPYLRNFFSTSCWYAVR